jgi:hypothetical protein
MLSREKWINFFAKGRHMLLVNIGPCDLFEPEILGGNALFAIDRERSL